MVTSSVRCHSWPSHLGEPVGAWARERRDPLAVALQLAGLMAVLLILLACGAGSRASTGEQGLVWEAWKLVNQTYVASDSVDSDKVSNEMIGAMLEMANKPSYPLLTELDSVGKRRPRAVPSELQNVWKLWILIREKWPEVDPRDLSTAAIRGIVAGLDDSTASYLSPEDYDRAREDTPGSYEGVGAFISVRDGRVLLSPIRDGPAAKAGILAGDELVAVDGQPVTGPQTDEVIDKLRGPALSRATLTIQRPGEENTRDFTVLRGTIDIPTVDVGLLPGAIGYISISEFRGTTPNEVLGVLEQLKQAEMLALVLDLRLNSGGSIEAARKVASQFLPGGLFMYEVDRNGNRTDWFIEEGGIATEALPLVVMVDEFTTDAAEAIAGALQDSQRSKVLGARTPGKGAAMSFVELSDGSAIRLPVSRWYTPLDRPILGEGIIPDIDVSLTDADRAVGRDAQLGEAYDYLNGLLPLFR